MKSQNIIDILAALAAAGIMAAMVIMPIVAAVTVTRSPITAGGAALIGAGAAWIKARLEKSKY